MPSPDSTPEENFRIENTPFTTVTPVDLDTIDGPLEVFLDRQRLWVDTNTIFGWRIAAGDNPDVVLGIIYNQIEDTTNPLTAIFGILQSIDSFADIYVDNPSQRVQDLQEFGMIEAVADFRSRLDDLYGALKSGTTVFLGLDLDKFKNSMLLAMDSSKYGIHIDRLKATARHVFEDAYSQESQNHESEYFYYYPDGISDEPQSHLPLSNLQNRIDYLKTLSPQEFLVAIFEDLKKSADDSLLPLEESARYRDSNSFALNVYQKYVYIAYVIRSALEEDKEVFLGDGSVLGARTLKEIKTAIEEAREQRREHPTKTD